MRLYDPTTARVRPYERRGRRAPRPPPLPAIPEEPPPPPAVSEEFPPRSPPTATSTPKPTTRSYDSSAARARPYERRDRRRRPPLPVVSEEFPPRSPPAATSTPRPKKPVREMSVLHQLRRFGSSARTRPHDGWGGAGPTPARGRTVRRSAPHDEEEVLSAFKRRRRTARPRETAKRSWQEMDVTPPRPFHYESDEDDGDTPPRPFRYDESGEL